MISRIFRLAGFTAIFFAVSAVSAYLALTLIIKSEDPVVVPDLEGKDVVYTLEILTDLGLNAKLSSAGYSPVIPKNHVVFQDPGPGEIIKKGRDVRIIISKGTQNVYMPNIAGVSLDKALIILEENGLYAGAISRTSDPFIPNDKVIAQGPRSGVLIKRGAAVNLLVSTGPKPKSWEMADLSGLTVEDAISSLEAHNLAAGDITTKYVKTKPEGAVLNQSPPSGYRITEGSRVNLVINRKPGLKEKTFVHDITGLKLFRHKLENGFLKKHIRVRLNIYGNEIDIINDFKKPGEDIWVLIPKNTYATVFLYEDDELIKTGMFEPYQ